MAAPTANVTETELAILAALWERGPSTVREIVEAVYAGHTHSLHATVKSLLERLDKKGLVACQRRGGAHFFSATLDREAFAALGLQSIADKAFGGSLAPLVQTLIDQVKLSRADRDAIRRIIDKIE